MFKISILLLSLIAVNSQHPTFCPSDSGLVLSGVVSFQNTGNLPTTIPSQNSLTYNVTLQYPFSNQPGTSLTINSFSSQTTPFLMFTAKPLPMASFGILPILFRFYQRYSLWVMLRVGYLVEQRSDIEADYYLIDTRWLGSDAAIKAVQISLPIKTTFSSPVAVYFLNGFELTSLPLSSNGNLYTPFQIVVAGKSSNRTHIVLVLSTQSASQVYSLLISYIAFENSTNLYSAGILQFGSASAATFTAPVNIPSQPLAQVDGIAGFVINNQMSGISFQGNLINNNTAFQFTSTTNITYLNHQYFFIPNLNSLCFFCQNNPLEFNGTCHPQCLQGTLPNNGQCSSCPPGQSWNGTHCLLACTGGRTWNSASSACQCPSNLVWNGNSCISCPTGQVWNSLKGECGCAFPDQLWTGMGCENISCGQNQIVNPFTFQCDCTLQSHWNGVDCILCQSLQVWNGSHCTCASNLVWNGSACSSCEANMKWDTPTGACICIPEANFNGFGCIVCTGGMLFDAINSQCVCPQGQVWNGSLCLMPCTLPLVYDNGQCVCPPGTNIQNGSCQTTPTCPSGQGWDGTTCSSINCAVGFSWNGTSCIQFVQACTLNSYWNGLACVTSSIQCPSGSSWNGTYCSPDPTCSEGTYLSGGNCLFFPQLCLPNYSWNGIGCLSVGLASSCLDQQIFNGTDCVGVTCSGGRDWSSLLNQCVCNSSSFWNGLGCVGCPSGQIFKSGGCGCPTGYFLIETLCYSLQEAYCTFVTYASWNGTNCVCNQGFTAVGVNCLCTGVIINQVCNPCFTKPHSEWINNQCQCQQNYYEVFGQCQTFSTPGNNTLCNAGTFLAAGQCVRCSDGCLSCTSQTVCDQCTPQFTYQWTTLSCLQICGDGLRFSLSCDDGNNVNGDGCSSDCRIEGSHVCYGGSPNSPDLCTQALPSSITIKQTGTSHLQGVININLKLNYLPSNLTDPSLACTDLCQQILLVTVVGGDLATLNIKSTYFPGTLSFSVSFVFGKEPIGQFVAKVQLNPVMASIYFPNLQQSPPSFFTVSPAFLAIYSPPDLLQ